MIYLDRKYFLLISSKLEKFKQKDTDLFNFRCPICSDSKKNKLRARGYVYAKDDSYRYWCHNCNYSTNVLGLLKILDSSLYHQYIVERFNTKHLIESNTTSNSFPIFHETKTISPQNLQVGDIIESLDKLPEKHWVLDYIRSRQIPKESWSEIYFAPNFSDFVKIIFPSFTKTVDPNPRLIFPLVDLGNFLLGFQGRALLDDNIKYITIKMDENNPKVFGWNKVDNTKPIYVFEGPIDSLFVENSIAVCDSNLMQAARYFPKENLVLVFDNQYHNQSILQQMERAISSGFSVCIFPKNINAKDINDLAKMGLQSSEIYDIIRNNTYKDLHARLEFGRIKNNAKSGTN